MADEQESFLSNYQERYAELQKKYSLPSLEELNFEFEVLDIITEKKVKTTFPLRYTRRIIVNILSNWTSYLHNFLMPNPQSAILIHESKYFSDEQKEEVNGIIKKIMLFNRLSTKLDLEHIEEKDAEFITNVYQEWLDIKKFILECADINIESWEKEVPSDKQPNRLIG